MLGEATTRTARGIGADIFAHRADLGTALARAVV